MSNRLKYAAAALIILVAEVLIALYVRDRFVRPYLGDVLVVIFLYAAVRIVFPEKIRLLPLWIFIFAVCVECLQGLRLVELLGLQNSTFFRILMGSVFDIKDIVCYAVGCIILSGYQRVCARRDVGK